MTYRYPVALAREAKGGFTVSFPDFPEAITFGESEAAALVNAVDCLDEVLATCINLGETIPKPSKVRKNFVEPSLGIAAKAALYEALAESSLPKSKLARQLDLNESEVRRMFDPRHPTKIPRIERALNFLGKRMTLVIEDL
jgi:antitoxin HicB